MVAFPTAGVVADLGSDPDLAAEVRDWLGARDGARSGSGAPVAVAAGGAADVPTGVAADVAVDGDGAAIGADDGAAGALVGLVARPSLLVGERQLATPVARTWQARL